jgi:hypothetical protein
VSVREGHVIVATGRSEERQVALADIRILKATKRDSVRNGILAGTALGFGGGAGLAPPGTTAADGTGRSLRAPSGSSSPGWEWWVALSVRSSDGAWMLRVIEPK